MPILIPRASVFHIKKEYLTSVISFYMQLHI